MYPVIHFPHKKLERPIDPIDFSGQSFAKVIDLPEDYEVVDLTGGYDAEKLRRIKAAVGGYNEKRNKMYLSPIFKNGRNIHMGVDIWLPPGTPVYAFDDGKILFSKNNENSGDYGPTLITEHKIDDRPYFALYGHLSKNSTDRFKAGQPIKKGEQLGELGDETENGSWVPHLHFQLSYVRPDGADLPGVVNEQDRELALACYPDPRNILGPIY